MAQNAIVNFEFNKKNNFEYVWTFHTGMNGSFG